MYTLDRLARNRYDADIYKAKFKMNGVKLLYAKQPMPDTPEGIISASLSNRLAELESQKKSIEDRITKEKMKQSFLTKDKIIDGMKLFKNGDIENTTFERTLISVLLNSVYVFDGDDGTRLIINILPIRKKQGGISSFGHRTYV